MNEPDFAIILIYLGAWFAVLFIYIIMISGCARRGPRVLWTVWAVTVLMIAGAAWLVTADLRAVADDAGLIVSFGATTALATWVVQRKQRIDPTVPFWGLAVTGLAAVIAASAVLGVLPKWC